MTDGNHNSPEKDRNNAKRFFERARTVSETGHHDFAISMYLQGLELDPDSVEAHKALREVAIKRKAAGGKSLGMLDSLSLKRPTKDDKKAMLLAEKLLAHEPGNTDYMVSLLQAAHRAGYIDTCMWIGDVLERANLDQKKPDIKKFLILKDVYRSLSEWNLAIQNAMHATKLKPEDMDLLRELREMSANQTIKQGNYTGGDFRQSIRDKEKQTDLLKQDKGVNDEDDLAKLIRESEAEYKAEPNVNGKVFKYVDALVKTEMMENENRAIEVLDEAYIRTKQFAFRRKIGEINMRQWSRTARAKQAEVKADPQNKELVREYQQLRKERLEFELKEYSMWAEQYSTEISLRFEQGRRLFELGRFDEAIPVLQRAANDPKFRSDARIILGRAFLESGYVDEAADTLQEAINDFPGGNDDKFLEMNYWRGRALEQKGDRDAAVKHYSACARLNFNFRDVQQRIKELRGKGSPA